MSSIKGWKEFCDWRRVQDLSSQADKMTLLNFCAARFKMSKAYRGIDFASDEYSENTNTVLIYNALLGVLFAFSSLELLYKYYKPSESLASLCVDWMIEDKELADELRSFFDADQVFDLDDLDFLNIKHLDAKKLIQNLKSFFAQENDNIMFVITAIRHLFVHGKLAANTTGCELMLKRKVFPKIIDRLHEEVETRFFLHVLNPFGIIV